MYYRRRGNAAETELLLNEGNGSLIEVYNGADARKAHAQEKHNAHYASAGHTVYDVHKVDEHKSRAAGVERRTARRHCGDDDESRQQRRKSVEQRDIAGGAGDALVLAEVGAVDNAAVAGHGQGEEGLAEGVYPKLGLQKSLGLERQDVAIALGGAGQEEYVHAQSKKQEKQNNLQVLLRLI